jgi:hypothetical protein
MSTPYPHIALMYFVWILEETLFAVTILKLMGMACVYCATLAECLNTIQASDNFGYYQGFRKHLKIIKDYLLTYMWYPTFYIKK